MQTYDDKSFHYRQTRWQQIYFRIAPANARYMVNHRWAQNIAMTIQIQTCPHQNGSNNALSTPEMAFQYFLPSRFCDRNRRRSYIVCHPLPGYDNNDMDHTCR